MKSNHFLIVLASLLVAVWACSDENPVAKDPANDSNIDLLAQLYNLKKGYYFQDSSKVEPLVLLHFTDVHLYDKGMDAIKLFQEEYSCFIDDVIHTGDFYDMGIIDNSLSHWDNNWLNVIGNHDAVTYDTSYHSVTPKVSYDTLFKPYIGNWGVTQPEDAETNGYCYYYKDYSSNKVRLVVLDYNNADADAEKKHWNNTQKTWFEGVLAETLDSKNSAYGYHIVVAVHCPPFIVEQDLNNPFQDIDFFNSRSDTRPMFEPCPSQIPNTIKSFIQNGGKFACWICGHTHVDFTGFNETYPGQLCVCIPNLRPTNEQCSARIVGTKTEYCFNMMAVDTITSTIKVLRLGCDLDRYMRRKRSFSFDYRNNKFITIN